MAQKVELKRLLAQINEEIRAAHDRATSDGSAVMQFEECELEFAVDFELKGEGGVDVYVFKLGAGATRTGSNVIRIKYKALANKPKVARGTVTAGVRTPPVRHGQREGS